MSVDDNFLRLDWISNSRYKTDTVRCNLRGKLAVGAWLNNHYLLVVWDWRTSSPESERVKCIFA